MKGAELEAYQLVISQSQASGASYTSQDIVPGGPAPPVAAAEYAAQALSSPEWPFPAKDDGWATSHRCQRRSMLLLTRGLQRIHADLSSGVPVPNHTYKALDAACKMWFEFAEEHHQNEELLVFPFMATKCTLPKKITADHATITAGIASLKEQLAALAKVEDGHKDMVASLHAFSAKLFKEIYDHFLEEEICTVPLLRINFTAKDYVPVVKKIIARTPPRMVGYLLSGGYELQADRMVWFKQEKVPAPVVALILRPQIAKAMKAHYRPLDLIARGEYTALGAPSGKTGLCGCFGA